MQKVAAGSIAYKKSLLDSQRVQSGAVNGGVAGGDAQMRPIAASQLAAGQRRIQLLDDASVDPYGSARLQANAVSRQPDDEAGPSVPGSPWTPMSHPHTVIPSAQYGAAPSHFSAASPDPRHGRAVAAGERGDGGSPIRDVPGLRNPSPGTSNLKPAKPLDSPRTSSVQANATTTAHSPPGTLRSVTDGIGSQRGVAWSPVLRSPDMPSSSDGGGTIHPAHAGTSERVSHGIFQRFAQSAAAIEGAGGIADGRRKPSKSLPGTPVRIAPEPLMQEESAGPVDAPRASDDGEGLEPQTNV
eukprot:359121-Chlamydomonas_euryale.AAC.2